MLTAGFPGMNEPVLQPRLVESQGLVRGFKAGIPDSRARAFTNDLVRSLSDGFTFPQLFKANLEHLKGDLFWSLK